jgi:hypothetical protein
VIGDLRQPDLRAADSERWKDVKKPRGQRSTSLNGEPQECYV